MDQGEVLHDLLHLLELEQRREAALTCQTGKREEIKYGRMTERGNGVRRRESLTVQTHVVEGEDGGPAGGPCAVQGHVQDAVWGLNAVLLNATQAEGDADVCESFNCYYGRLFSILFYIYYSIICLFLSFIFEFSSIRYKGLIQMI